MRDQILLLPEYVLAVHTVEKVEFFVILFIRILVVTALGHVFLFCKGPSSSQQPGHSFLSGRIVISCRRAMVEYTETIFKAREAMLAWKGVGHMAWP